MAMSDCEKCWNTPCTCGWDYKGLTNIAMADFIADILRYRSKEEAKQILSKAVEMIDNHLNWYEKE